MQTNLVVAATPANIAKRITAIQLDPASVNLPAAYELAHVNDINSLARTILTVADIRQLSPNTIQFLGKMCGVNFVSPKQRKWLLDLRDTHLGKDMELAA